MKAIRTTLACSFEDAVERVKGAFKEQGFGTLTEIDVQKTLKEKIGADIRPYTVLGVCNPNLAYRAIEAESEVGVLMPCTVLVQEVAGKIEVTAQDPVVTLTLAENEGLDPIGREARERMAAAIASLA
jgi:uncharacterized protein (DUF302 family)